MIDPDTTTLLALYDNEAKNSDNHNPDLEQVERFVRSKHSHQVRKDGTPYIGHLLNVRDIAGAIARQTEVLPYHVVVCAAAGALHDSCEDQGVDFEDLVEVANTEVALLVAFVSDDKRLPSQLRHQRYLERLTVAPFHAQIVKLADLTDNSNDAVMALDPKHLVEHFRKEQGALTLAHSVVQQQLERNRVTMARWATKARETLAILSSVSKLRAYEAVRATIDLVLSKAKHRWTT
jgi:(p)ppGpp synthase/HD superfamily hydrolase